MKSRLYLLVFSLLLNALGNAVAITTNLGANPWTAAGQGLAATLTYLSVQLWSALVFSYCC